MPELTRSAARQLCWDYLGTKSTDKFFTVAKLDTHLDLAYDKIITDIQATAPNFGVKKVTLSADSALGRLYSMQLQPVAIVDFSRVVELRLTDASGIRLVEAKDEELANCDGPRYSVTGDDLRAVIETSRWTAVGTDLYLKYEYNPVFGSNVGDTPVGIPEKFQVLVPLNASEVLASLGNESVFPQRLATIREDMEAKLLLKVGRRSTDAVTTRAN